MDKMTFQLLLAVATICCSGCGRGDAWQIVKQRTNDHFRHENYGYVNNLGHVYAGFRTKAEAEEAMNLVGARGAKSDWISTNTWERVK